MTLFGPCKACQAKDESHARELAARDAEIAFLRALVSTAKSIIREPLVTYEESSKTGTTGALTLNAIKRVNTAPEPFDFAVGPFPRNPYQEFNSVGISERKDTEE